MCWSAFHELCDMGVQLDLDKIYSLSLANAAENMQQYASHESSSDWKNLNPQLFPKKKLGSKVQPHPSLMETRKSVEKIRDYRCSPAAATSLGLSSCAVRIGFATPGGMPSPTMAPLSMGQMSMLSNTHMSFPPTAYSTEHSITDRTPLQATSNPLQYLLQSRYRSQHGIDSQPSSNLTPTSRVTKHLFPMTGEPVSNNRTTVQLFDTPDLVDTVEQRDEFETKIESGIAYDREMTIRGMATPGLTPIERKFRDSDDGEVIDGDDNLLVYGKSTQKIDKASYSLDEDDTFVDIQQRTIPRDDVRRRVSFGPMIEEKHEGMKSIIPFSL